MKIRQFKDEGLAQFAYALVHNHELVLIDPARDPEPYLALAAEEHARIVAVIETHPHADFVSSHAEIAAATGARVLVSQRVQAAYAHTTFDEGDTFEWGPYQLRPLNTPGHSPDSICIVLSENGQDQALFSGDTLLIGDVGRPDLRETGQDQETDRKTLARAMYRSTREKLMQLPDDVVVYPAHGGGSLCSKSQDTSSQSTIRAEKLSNPALQEMDEQAFIDYLLADQPFVPRYFPYDVQLNRKGAPAYRESLQRVPRLGSQEELEPGALVIDARKESVFRQGHLAGAINLMNGGKFETWLGAIVAPGEPFYLVAASERELDELIRKAAKIGYEGFIRGGYAGPVEAEVKRPVLDVPQFLREPERYTVVDVRNAAETAGGKVFAHSLTIPLYELRDRWQEVPVSKPVVVHCAAGYRSAAGTSMLEALLPEVPVYDLGEQVKAFQP